MSWSETYNSGSNPIIVISGGGAGLRTSQASTFGGAFPTATDAVVMSAGQNIIWDSSFVCASLDIQGTLTADQTMGVNVTAGNINIGANGALIVGTEAAPYPAAYTATITLNGPEVGRTTRTVSGTNLGFTNNGVGRSIQVQPGGTLNLIGGNTPTFKRSKLNANAATGTNTFTTMDATGWLAGDDIVMGTTDFFGVSVPEKLTLTANASGTSIQTTGTIASSRWGALQYVTDSGMSLSAGTLTGGAPAGVGAASATPTVLDERAFLVNLRRNIIVQGANDTAWTANKFGVHMMFMSGGTSTANLVQPNVKIDGVHVIRCGQAGAIGRYPIHWHMCSYRMDGNYTSPSTTGTFIGNLTGNYAKNCAIEQSGQRMITVHGTHGVTVDSNVGFDITGHGIFLEDGSEQDNVITNNVVMKIRAPTSTNKLLNHDQAATGVGSEYLGLYGTNGSSGIWNTNPQNTCTGNWVNDSEGTGIWNAFSTQCFGLSVNVALVPSTTVFTSFQNNVAYACQGVGVQTNRPVIDELGNTSNSATYQGSFFAVPVIGTQTFKNGAGGYSNRVLDAQYQNFVGADNMGMDVFGQAQMDRSIAVNFLTVAESLNNATSRAASSKRAAFATYHELLNFQNCLVVGYSYIGGTQYNDTQTFTGGGMFRMDDLYLQPIFTFFANIGHKLINTPAPYRAKSANIDGAPVAIPSHPGVTRNWALAGAIRDLNGLFVTAGSHWIYDDTFFTTGASGLADVPLAGSNGKETTTRFFGVYNFIHTQSNNPFLSPMTVTRQDTSGTTVGTWVLGDGATSIQLGWMRHFAAMNGARYMMTLPGVTVANTVYAFTILSQDNASDIFMLGLEWSGSVPAKVYERAQQFAFTGIIPAAPTAGDISAGIGRILTSTGSLANVQADTTGTIFYQDTAANMVWFQVKVGALAIAYGTGYGTALNPSTTYKQVAIAITA